MRALCAVRARVVAAVLVQGGIVVVGVWVWVPIDSGLVVLCRR